MRVKTLMCFLPNFMYAACTILLLCLGVSVLLGWDLLFFGILLFGCLLAFGVVFYFYGWLEGFGDADMAFACLKGLLEGASDYSNMYKSIFEGLLKQKK